MTEEDPWARQKPAVPMVQFTTRLPADLLELVADRRHELGLGVQTVTARAFRAWLAGPASVVALRAAVQAAEDGELTAKEASEALEVARALVAALEVPRSRTAPRKQPVRTKRAAAKKTAQAKPAAPAAKKAPAKAKKATAEARAKRAAAPPVGRTEPPAGDPRYAGTAALSRFSTPAEGEQ